MLKMLTLFQGLPGQQPVPGVLDRLGSPQKEPSTSEAGSEASMSEASSEDLVPPLGLEAEAAPEREEEEALKKKKKKKTKGLANMFSVFTKGKKKKGQPSSAEPEGELQAPPGPAARLPTGDPASVLSGTPTGLSGRMASPFGFSASPPVGAMGGERDIINSPKLAGELQGVKLGSLLPRKQIQLLEATFLSNEVTSVKELMARALRLESQRWAQDVAPQRLDGHCHSELAIDIIQIVSQGQAKAESITLDLGMQIKQMLVMELAAFLRSLLAEEAAADPGWHPLREPRRALASASEARGLPRAVGDQQSEKRSVNPGGCYRPDVCAGPASVFSGFASYQRAFDDFLERCKQLKNYRVNIIANINNGLSFRTSVEQKWQSSQDLLGPLSELKGHGFDALLQSLFGDLKPLFKRFTQTRWAAPAQTLEAILFTVGERLPEFSELHDCFREELMELIHLHLVKEYIIRLSKRRVVLKTAEQQQQLARHILANADLIQRFCTQNGSPAAWLHQALPTLAEIIRLQDPSAIKIEVATYATCYPDFSKGHLSAILSIKGNLSNNEVKSIRSILDVNTGAHEPVKSLFSLIKIA
ncbi:Tumor necrosis factor, alpha-induced protein 2 [Pteropus alecto]|uniref:Tumor necrosis factor alpha-induced protein 2 n=1 Tax=Pteropus alecto TaxID=9402 RepID=L5JR31_PTEAL|nr:Tumor necrosis factor, alpha-induced protein 2 [Pteropus alecto]